MAEPADTVTRNVIDFIIADKKDVLGDVSVINRLNTGSTLKINLHYRLMKSILRLTLLEILCGCEQFQVELKNRYSSLEITSDVDKSTDKVVKTVCTLGRRHTAAIRLFQI